MLCSPFHSCGGAAVSVWMFLGERECMPGGGAARRVVAEWNRLENHLSFQRSLLTFKALTPWGRLSTEEERRPGASVVS